MMTPQLHDADHAAIAAKINSEHSLAMSHADMAIDHAKRAGDLLLQMKNTLPHGDFLPWIAANIAVSERQAQRYIRAALGKPLPVRAIANTTQTSDLKSSLADWPLLTPIPDWPAPTFMPTPSHWMCVADSGAAWWIVPSLEHDGFFHVSKLHGDVFDGTRRPVRADAVEGMLQHLGMTDPSQADWKARAKTGLTRPFGEPDDHE